MSKYFFKVFFHLIPQATLCNQNQPMIYQICHPLDPKNQSLKAIGNKKSIEMVQKGPFLPFLIFSETKTMKTECFFLIMLHFPRSIKLCFKRIIMMNIHNPLRLNTFQQCSDIFMHEKKCFSSFYRLNKKKIIFFLVVPRGTTVTC